MDIINHDSGEELESPPLSPLMSTSYGEENNDEVVPSNLFVFMKNRMVHNYN